MHRIRTSRASTMGSVPSARLSSHESTRDKSSTHESRLAQMMWLIVPSLSTYRKSPCDRTSACQATAPRSRRSGQRRRKSEADVRTTAKHRRRRRAGGGKEEHLLSPWAPPLVSTEALSSHVNLLVQGPRGNATLAWNRVKGVQAYHSLAQASAPRPGGVNTMDGVDCPAGQLS